MSLNSPLFIFTALPILFFIYLVPGRRVRRIVLLLSGILFYAWLDLVYLPVILFYLLLNYYFGRWLASKRIAWGMWVILGLNVFVLVAFKFIYSPTFQPIILEKFPFLPNHMPVGISFISFTTIAYLVDCYMGRVKEPVGLVDYSVLQMFFAKIIAGPIVRLSQMGKQAAYDVNVNRIAGGIRRFILGLAKKILIADTLGFVVDQVFLLHPQNLYTQLAWIGILFYSLQIFFDFSGYTDMALGLGQIFGLELPENFNFPYLAQGIGDFWRRWHITLSNWFRDYIFFPLERKRRGKTYWNQHYNVLIVFLATGLWHGFTLTFIIWGLLHGCVIVLENSSAIGGWIKRTPPVFKHAYTLVVLILSWVFFRSSGYKSAIIYLSTMFIYKKPIPLPLETMEIIEPITWAAFLVGAIWATNPKVWLGQLIPEKWKAKMGLIQGAGIVYDVFLLGLFAYAIITAFGRDSVSFLYGNF